VDEQSIQEVARILASWNPLAARADEYTDLDGYRVEAIDIICQVSLHKPNTVNGISALVRDVLNQAFMLSLSARECKSAAREIYRVLSKTGV